MGKGGWGDLGLRSHKGVSSGWPGGRDGGRGRGLAGGWGREAGPARSPPTQRAPREKQECPSEPGAAAAEPGEGTSVPLSPRGKNALPHYACGSCSLRGWDWIRGSPRDLERALRSALGWKSQEETGRGGGGPQVSAWGRERLCAEWAPLLSRELLAPALPSRRPRRRQRGPLRSPPGGNADPCPKTLLRAPRRLGDTRGVSSACSPHLPSLADRRTESPAPGAEVSPGASQLQSRAGPPWRTGKGCGVRLGSSGVREGLLRVFRRWVAHLRLPRPSPRPRVFRGLGGQRGEAGGSESPLLPRPHGPDSNPLRSSLVPGLSQVLRAPPGYGSAGARGRRGAGAAGWPRRPRTLPPRRARGEPGPGDRVFRRGTQGAGAGLHTGPVSSAVPESDSSNRSHTKPTSPPRQASHAQTHSAPHPASPTHPSHRTRHADSCVSLRRDKCGTQRTPRTPHTRQAPAALPGSPHSHLRPLALTPLPGPTHPDTRGPAVHTHPSRTQSSHRPTVTHAHPPPHTQMLHTRPPSRRRPRGAGGVWGPPLSPAGQTSGPFSPPGQRKAACPASAAGGAARQAAQHCGLVPPGGPGEGGEGQQGALRA